MHATATNTAPSTAAYSDILTPEAIAFLHALQQKFGATRQSLLARRVEVQQKINNGWLPDFLPETQHIREGVWQIAPIPTDLQNRRVEITGPVERKMIINALNSGANCFMADFEDSSSPTFDNMLEGQRNLRDAVRKTISYTDPTSGKQYALNPQTAVLIVRPRGWHLEEAHFLVEGKPMSGSLFDFGLYLFHNAKELLQRGTAPYFYLPKLENHLEARLWNEVIVYAQQQLGLPQGTIKATVLIETILAPFEAEEILFELKEHIVALNCGRWDYIFSYIKKFANDPTRLLPDRAQVTMTVPFMRNYTQHIIKICHKRGAFAMGGMAAQIPIKNDEVANEVAMARVRADKEREVTDGHDGTWVAHPALVPIAKAIFDKHMPTPNQVFKQRDDVQVVAADLLTASQGTITEQGLRMNIRVGLGYLTAWLGGNGCVPLYNLMEDAATAEISRAQVWQWVKHHAVLEDGRTIDKKLFGVFFAEEVANLQGNHKDSKHFTEACKIFEDLCTRETFTEFLTLPAYRVLTADNNSINIAVK